MRIGRVEIVAESDHPHPARGGIRTHLRTTERHPFAVPRNAQSVQSQHDVSVRCERQALRRTAVDGDAHHKFRVRLIVVIDRFLVVRADRPSIILSVADLFQVAAIQIHTPNIQRVGVILELPFNQSVRTAVHHIQKVSVCVARERRRG